ncbi:hypothetical protein CR513_08504, partial [Mucuna pruriens]
MAAKVLISNDFQPSRGMGKELDGMAELNWLYGDCKNGKTRAENLGHAMDTAEPLSPFHQWGHNIPRSNCNDRGSTPKADRMGIPYGIGVGQLDG